jgi:hypothetical protein
MPKTSKPKPSETYVAIESWAGNDMSVARGLRLRGDNPIVQRFPDRFLPATAPDDEFARARAAFNAPAPLPEPIGRVRLRVLPTQGIDTLAGGGPPQTVEHRGRTLVAGDTFVTEGADAQYLLDIGVCAIVESLPKRLAKTGRAIANGTED